MFENLLNLVREHAGDAIINNPEIPNDKNEDAISETTHGIIDTLKSGLRSGDLSSITSIFNNETLISNPMIHQIIENVSSRLSQKFGLNAGSANNVASQLIPNVMSKLAGKTNDPNDQSFSMDGIMASLSNQSGALGGMMDSVKGMFGK